MSKRSIMDIDVRDRLVLVRVDFNIPIEMGTERLTAYDHRLRATLPTIYYLLGSNARIVLCTHIGRPDGRVVEDLRLAPVAQRLSDLLQQCINYTQVALLNQGVACRVTQDS